MSNPSNPESDRMASAKTEYGRISKSANTESVRMEYGRTESVRGCHMQS
jgi:hypothetical protein